MIHDQPYPNDDARRDDPAEGDFPRGPPADALPGFVFLQRIGRGGMGEVHRARQQALDREVAVKFIPKGGLAPERRDRFRREALALARLSHPRIVDVHDFISTPDGADFLVMEFVPGTDVARRLEAGGPLPAREALAIAREALEALDFAHRHGVVHRDIKPGNLLLDEGGHVKVADFGLATWPGASDAGWKTSTRQVLGTPEYLAPECLRPGVVPDAKADVYALGATLYQMLTGLPPRGLFKLPSLLVPGLDPRWDAVLCRALEPEPDDRTPSAAAMLADLRELDGPFPATPAPVARPRRATVRIAMGAAALLAVGLGVAIRFRPPPPARPEPAPAAAAPDDKVFAGHRYEWVPGECTWEAAAKKAANMGGSLAVPSNPEEVEWIRRRFGVALAPGRLLWLGGARDASGAWTGLTGEFLPHVRAADAATGYASSRLAMARDERGGPGFAWLSIPGDARPVLDSGPDQGGYRCAGFPVEWNADASRPFVQTAPWRDMPRAEFLQREGEWNVLPLKEAWRTPRPITDGAIRMTCRYQRDGGSLALRYRGYNQTLQLCFVSGEGSQVVFLVAPTLKRLNEGKRWTFDLPFRLREGEVFTLEASLVGDRFAVACNGFLAGTGVTGLAEDPPGPFSICGAAKSPLLTRAESWREF